MTELEDDIARVAALRGRPAAELVERAQRAPKLNRAQVEMILTPGPDPVRDQVWFDELPEKSRAFIRECERPLSASWWAWNLHECGGQEDELIKAVAWCLAR